MPWHLFGLALLVAFDPSVLQPGVTVIGPAPPTDGQVQLAPGERREVFAARGAGLIRELTLTPPKPSGPGLRLLMTWDGAAEPSVDAPVVDLMGASEGAPAYSCLLGEVSDEVWSLRLPMPFGDGAKIELINESGTPVSTRVGCQWDRLSEPPARARLHVAWRRQTLSAPGSGRLLEVQGTPGQVAAVRLDLRLTDDADALPGALRAELDGQPEGLVASGWRELFRNATPRANPESGLLAGDLQGDLRRVVGYRLFGEPLHFEQSCRLSLDYSGVQRPEPAEVDVTSTVYWYAKTAQPSGGAALDPLQRTCLFLGRLTPSPPKPEELFRRLIGDRDAILGFDDPSDWSRVIVRRPGGKTPRWIDTPGNDIGQPHPGRQGIGVLAPPEPGYSCRLYWKVMTPPGARLLRYVLSADPHRGPDQPGVRFTLSVCDGQHTTQLTTRTLTGRGGPTEAGWLREAVPIGHPGSAVLVILEVSGPSVDTELFIDRLSLE